MVKICRLVNQVFAVKSRCVARFACVRKWDIVRQTAAAKNRWNNRMRSRTITNNDANVLRQKRVTKTASTKCQTEWSNSNKINKSENASNVCGVVRYRRSREIGWVFGNRNDNNRLPPQNLYWFLVCLAHDEWVVRHFWRPAIDLQGVKQH